MKIFSVYTLWKLILVITFCSTYLISTASFSQCDIFLIEGTDDQSNNIQPSMPCMRYPTSSGTIIRYGVGEFNAPRNGMPDGHKGIDIILKEEQRQCIQNTDSIESEKFLVYSVGDGKVSYARLNGAIDQGLGFTIIIDHGQGLYSLYSHLAQDPKTNRCFPQNFVLSGGTLPVSVGDDVKAGDIIGYMGQLTSIEGNAYDGPTGNAIKTDQPIQLHFELFHEDPGKMSEGTISSITPVDNRGRIDPTKFLKKLHDIVRPNPPEYVRSE